MPEAQTEARGFDHVEAWIFDLDNTLYPADCNLFAEIDTRMGTFIADRFGISLDAAQRMRKAYYYEYGTTLAGLMQRHQICPDSFLDYVHDIDLSVVAPAPELVRAIADLPGRKFIFTNGSRQHAEGVMTRLGLEASFDGIFDIRSADFVPKPEPDCYQRFLRAHGIAGSEAAMFDDLPQNLREPHALGMTTVLVACAPTDHPDHQSISGWTALPSYIDHRTEALTPFLEPLGASRRRSRGGSAERVLAGCGASQD